MRQYLYSIMLVAVVAFSAGCSGEKQPPLLDREVFFDDPVISGGQLSPDGAYISFLKPYNGTRNIWVKTREASFEEALPVTSETQRPIRSYFWSRDGKYILYVQDKGGDENFNLYAVNPSEATANAVPEARNLTGMTDVRVQIYQLSRIDQDLLFIGINNRDKAWHDLYSLRLSSGELKLLRENTNRYTSWIFDYNDNLRLAGRSRPDGTSELWRMDSKGETLLYSSNLFETAYPAAFTKDNRNFYLVSNVGDSIDLTQLYLMDIETGSMELVESDPEGKADFGDITISDKTLDVLYTSYTDAYTRHYFKNKEFEGHYNKLKSKFPGMEISLYGATTDERYWMMAAWSDRNPGEIYIYDTSTGETSFQYNPRPTLPSDHLSEMKSITYPSSDGLEIQAYLTLPKGFGEKNLPMVVFPHGGPWARDSWGFDSYTQFMANRGYAVLQPNFRASTGFGKAFLNAGNHQWGQLMQDDITWGIKYLVDQGIVDPERVAIFGISYGGYATLAGLAFTPELYACGISYVGPSNLFTLLNSIPPYWEAMRKSLYVRMGNPDTDEGREVLKRQSPLFAAEKIAAPLMVVQGFNDPRVKNAESEQIVVALRDRGFPVEYINAPDEGHGFARPINTKAFIAAMEKFFASHLKGRYQQDIPEEVAKRLQEISVDVTTVKLPEGL